jgi:hypothetical protein
VEGEGAQDLQERRGNKVHLIFVGFSKTFVIETKIVTPDSAL